MIGLACLLLCTSFAASAAASYVIGEGVRAHGDAYARAAHLQPLKSSGPDEIRVWTEDYMGRRVTGYVVSNQSAMKCLTSYVSASPRQQHCRRSSRLALSSLLRRSSVSFQTGGSAAAQRKR